jgi:hypothetical protein
MEGYSLIEGFTRINHYSDEENTYKYPLYEGVLKMNMKHAEKATCYTLKYNIEQAMEYGDEAIRYDYEPMEYDYEPMDDSDEAQYQPEALSYPQTYPEEALLVPPEIYIGGFHNNQRDGHATIYSSIWETDYGADETYRISHLTGDFYMITDMIPKVFEGNFEFDKKNGYGITWNNRDERQPDGTSILQYEKWREGNFLNDQPHGRGFKEYHPHEAGLKAIATYDNGKRVGGEK